MAIPHTIGRYAVEQVLGRGGMATVFLALDPYMQRRVAIKMLSSAFMQDPEFQRRFQREAQTVAQLEHAYIVPVYDFGEHEGQQYLVMRNMTNHSLAYWLKQGSLPISDCVMVLERMADALDEAHSQGIVHRDFKPANVLFDRQGGAYLSDFGLVKLVHESTASSNVVAGTAHYMSPEQVLADREVDGRTDIYAMGVTLFEMLTGRTPYIHDVQTKLMMMHVLDPIPSIRSIDPGLPLEVEAIVCKAMAKKPDDRFQTAGEMVDALTGVGQGILTRRARKRWMSDELADTLDEIIGGDSEGQQFGK